MVEADKDFCFSWPYGVLKVLQVAAPFATLVTIYLGPYKYSSIGFILFVSWTFFIANLFYLLFYIFNVQKRSLSIGSSAIAYMPLALTDFFLSCFGTLLFCISSLICLICVFTSIEHRVSVLLTYVFSFIFTLISFLAFAYYAILIYRAMPNGRWHYLQFLIVNGKEITVHPASGLPTSSTTFSSHQSNNFNRPSSAGYVV
ncbi:MARVEL domain-containing protein [Aphelenchoides besseyi]|nr:MARVEL domain-containing protein [Aphelenchoides besseyi]